MTDLSNTYLGQYQLIEAIGHGGMATVYKAYQESLDRFVAIKVLLSNRDPQFAVRFKREARAIATLQHHNILPIYDYGEQDGLLYFVLQYVENAATLHDLLGKPMAPGQALRLISHVLAALEYAHARGVVHRDLKPANVLLPSPNWALLADFGIAKLLNDSQHLTMTGFIIGTAAYMAPEQAAGRPVDARTDLYSLGVVLYEMLTGRVPFDSDTPMAVLTKHVYEAPPPPRQLNPNIPPALEAVLMRALAKDPNARYQSSGEMREEVERIAAQFERPRPPSQVTGMYRAGVEAFQRGDWDAAVEQFSQLAALAPDYEDAGMMLNAARLAQQQSTGLQMRSQPLGTQPEPTAPAPANTAPVTSQPAAPPVFVPFSHGIQPRPAPATTPPTVEPVAPVPTFAPAPADSARPSPAAPPTLPGAAPAWSAPRVGEPVPSFALPANQSFGGATLENVDAPAEPANRRMLWVAIALVVVLIGGIGGFLLFGRNTAEADPGGGPPIAATTPTTAPTRVATATATAKPTATATAKPTATATAKPTATASPTATEVPTEAPTATPAPKPTPRPRPTATPAPPPPPPPTDTPAPPPPPPTDTPAPPPPPTDTPAPPPPPTDTPKPRDREPTNTPKKATATPRP